MDLTVAQQLVVNQCLLSSRKFHKFNARTVICIYNVVLSSSAELLNSFESSLCDLTDTRVHFLANSSALQLKTNQLRPGIRSSLILK